MSSTKDKRLIFEKNRLYFLDEVRGRVELIRFDDVFQNLGRVPLHTLDEKTYIVWTMTGGFEKVAKKITESGEAKEVLTAAAISLMIRECWGRYRPRPLLCLGEMTDISLMLAEIVALFHDENILYCLSPKSSAAPIRKKNIARITADYESFPFPAGYFDVVFARDALSPATYEKLVLSLRPGGLLLALLPDGHGFPLSLPGTLSLSGDDGLALVYGRVTSDAQAAVRAGTKDGYIAGQRAIISCIVDEVRGSLPTLLASHDEAALDICIEKIALAEEVTTKIFDEMDQSDLKYRLSLLKEAVTDYRLERDASLRPARAALVWTRCTDVWREITS